MKKLSAHIIDGHHIEIRPAPSDRDWMDMTGQRFAYRCLPLSIANAHGWEILCASGFEVLWDGDSNQAAIRITADPGTIAPAVSHFGHAVLTFHVPCLFQTESGFDLMVQGPINRPKDAIAPLSGVIEADWSPYSFTMNWMFTRPGIPVRFEKGEPFCHIFPVRRGELETIEPELRLLSESPELKRQHEEWTASRASFNVDLKRPGSAAQEEGWQKRYHRGVTPEGKPAPIEDHRTRLRLKPFRSTLR
jgi:hypothetical protein